MFECIDVKVDNGMNSVHFRFVSMASAMDFAKNALLQLVKEDSYYHEPGVTLTIKEIEEKDEEKDEEAEEEEE